MKSTEYRAAIRAAGTGYPAGSPYHVGVKEPTENQRNGIVEISVLRLLNQTFDRNGVGACRRPALPGPPGGPNFLLTVITYVNLIRNREITSVVCWRRQLQPDSNMPAGDFFVVINNNTL